MRNHVLGAVLDTPLTERTREDGAIFQSEDHHGQSLLRTYLNPRYTTATNATVTVTHHRVDSTELHLATVGQQLILSQCGLG